MRTLIYAVLYVMTLNRNIPNILLKHKQLVILSVAAIVLAVYILPLDSLFANQATAQSRDNSYGHARQGPPPATPGGIPGSHSQGVGPPEPAGPPAPRAR
jgi:hypothetical protein